MNAEQTKIIQLKATIHALEELLSVSETCFLAESNKLEKVNAQLEEEIKKHEKLEEEYRILFESSVDAIMTLDPNAGFVDCNNATLELFGFSSKEQFIKNSPGDLSAAEQPDGRDSLTAARDHIEKACREGSDFFEWIHARQDGTLFPAEVLLSRMKYQDNIMLQATVRDITERKRVEQELARAQKIAEESAQQQGRIEMANNILHDIGNAMTGISTCIFKPQMKKKWIEIQSLYKLYDLFAANEQSLINVLGREKQQALNNFMKALITSFEELNSNNLDFHAKISSAVRHICSVLDLQRHYLRENITPLSMEINLATIIEDSLVMMSGSLRKRKIEVRFKPGNDIPKISGDQTRLIRVFLNIIKNVCEAFDEAEYTENRKLEINIGKNESRREIRVEFLDNAIGFDPETGKELLKRGYTSKPNGSGIGLHESRSIIDSHGGTMAIESKGINTGALTIITFPLKKKE